MLENSDNNIPPEKRLSRIFNLRFKNLYLSFLEQETDEEKKGELLKNIEIRMGGLVGANYKLKLELINILEKEKTKSYPNIDEWINNLSEKISTVILRNYTLDELEKIFYDLNLKRNNLPINRMLTYSIDTENETLGLHVTIIFVKNPIEIRKLFIEGMKILAEKLNTDENLKNIKKVEGISNLLFKHQNILKTLGFELINKNEQTELATVSISREKFLSIFSENKIDKF